MKFLFMHIIWYFLDITAADSGDIGCRIPGMSADVFKSLSVQGLVDTVSINI